MTTATVDTRGGDGFIGPLYFVSPFTGRVVARLALGAISWYRLNKEESADVRIGPEEALEVLGGEGFHVEASRARRAA